MDFWFYGTNVVLIQIIYLIHVLHSVPTLLKNIATAEIKITNDRLLRGSSTRMLLVYPTGYMRQPRAMSIYLLRNLYVI